MNFLQHLLEFDTVETGKKNLKEAADLYDKMGGGLYRSILHEDIMEIREKLNNMENTEFINRLKNKTDERNTADRQF